jgi:hypothetical protein
MKLFSYVLRRDYGFSPNPFEGYCTLATCKPVIRRNANVGDWIVGTGSVKNVGQNKIIYAMKVTEKIDFNEYWNDQRFNCKKSNMNGSFKNRVGDNIYELTDPTNKEKFTSWKQHNSYHSKPNGTEDRYRKNGDLKGIYVLISNTFYYFGENAPIIPDKFLYAPDIRNKLTGYKCNFPKKFIEDFVEWVKEIAIDEELGVCEGILGFPCHFNLEKKSH